ncbi:MAG: MBL fold metallo-hydrolase [Pseudomonadota bacterium]
MGRYTGSHERGLTRRHALGGLGAVGALTATAGAAGLAGLDAHLTAATAATPQSAQGAATARMFKLGDFEVITVFDGFANVPRVHPIFGNNQSPEAVADLLTNNFLPADKTQFHFTPVIVKAGGETILFDAGNGPGRGETRGTLLSSLEAAGIKSDAITTVVLTHYHPDHVGGLMRDGKETFPNARYLSSEAEHNFWTSDTVLNSSDKQMQGRAKFIKDNVLPIQDKFTFLKDGADVVTGVTAVATFGHTPGHLAFNIESNGKRLLLWADACNHYVASLQKPEWHVVFDMDKDAAIASRKKVLDMAAADKVPATGYHMPFPAVGYVDRVNDSFRWVPHSYQLDI